MTGINAYTTHNIQANTHQNTTAITPQKAPAPPPQSNALTQTGDRGSLSPEIETARTRDALGLPPTGNLKFENFQETAKAQAHTMDQIIAQKAKALGIDSNQPMGLAMDPEGNLIIQEEFEGKNDLVKALNQDDKLLNALGKCSACNEIIDLTRALSLAEFTNTHFMDPDRSWDDILSLAKKHKEIKTSQNDLATLAGIGRREFPHTHSYDPDTSQ